MDPGPDELGFNPDVPSALFQRRFRVRRTSSPSVQAVIDGLEVRRTDFPQPEFLNGTKH